MREYNGRTIELLAPAGTFRDFEEIIHSKADAVYLGGKDFNMRMHKKSHNLSNDEIKKAIEIAHGLKKKAYITFNNMMTGSELKEAEEFLRFLEQAQADALIVQDFGAAKLIRDLDLDLELHLSVMANVHNKEMAEAATALGVTRVVLSRELTFDTVKGIVKEVPEMEYEYFTHGDMCVAHGAQCYYSSIVFGSASNRGRCLKPCRWGFQDASGEIHFPLAVKDLSFYRHIPELLNSGINSFKIEGRMRDSDYLIDMIDIYADAITRYLEDPLGYSMDLEGFDYLDEYKIRNLSTAYGFHIPGSDNIDLSGEREPRIFSLPKEEGSITEARLEELMDALAVSARPAKELRVSVTVNDMEGFRAAADSKADIIYLSGESFKPAKGFGIKDIREAGEYAKGSNIELHYALPRMTNEMQFKEIDSICSVLGEWEIGLVVSNLGQINRYKGRGLELVGDYGLNIYNDKAVAYFKSLGLRRVTLSIEARANVLSEILDNKTGEIEIIAQGAPTAMYMEHCLKAAEHGKTRQDWCEDYCLRESMDLIDSRGFKRIIKADKYCKNHMITSKDLCHLPLLEELNELGVDVVRIEGKHYDGKILGDVIKFYKETIETLGKGHDRSLAGRKASAEKLKEITKREQTLGGLVS